MRERAPTGDAAGGLNRGALPLPGRSWSGRRSRSPRLLLLLAGLLAVYLAAPFAAALRALPAAGWDRVNLAGLGSAAATSAGAATLATLLVALGGIPLGYVLARRPGWGTSLLGFLVQLPLALPPLASGVLLLFLLGYASPLGRLTGGALTDSFLGVVLAEAFVAAPFLVIAARSAFAALDPAYEDVAATLGHAPASVFWWISLPLAWRGLLAGMLLAWLRGFGEFGATVMVAYHPISLPVFTYIAFGSLGLRAMLPVLAPTIGVALVVMLLLRCAAPPRSPRAGMRRARGDGTTGTAAARPIAWPFRISRVGLAWRGPGPAGRAASDSPRPAPASRDFPARPPSFPPPSFPPPSRSETSGALLSALVPPPPPSPPSAPGVAAPDLGAAGPAASWSASPAVPLGWPGSALARAVGGGKKTPRGSVGQSERSDGAGPDDRSAVRAVEPARLDFAFRRALHGFSLEVDWRPAERRLAILGASGSGKSMTLRLLAGLDPADAASVTCAGRDLTRLPAERRGVAYVPQGYALPPHLTVARQIGFARDADPLRIRWWTERLGVADLARRYPSELSPGQQQRVALARALARPARLLLLDEPFSALDAPLRTRLRGELLALQSELDAVTLLVTHDPAEASLLADELLLLEAGRVLQAGPAAAVFLRPASATAARLLGADMVCAGRAAGPQTIDIGGGIGLAVGAPALPLGAALGWAVRPDRVRPVAEAGYPATIEMVEPVRDGARGVTLRCGDARLRAVIDPSTPVSLGAACRIAIDPAAIQVWPAASDDRRPGPASPAG